jgi:hypothetical protein
MKKKEVCKLPIKKVGTFTTVRRRVHISDVLDNYLDNYWECGTKKTTTCEYIANSLMHYFPSTFSGEVFHNSNTAFN